LSGTRAGGLAARDANLAKDPDFYRRVGKKGGQVKHRETRYFYLHRGIARIAGKRGGTKSRIHKTREVSNNRGE